MFVFARAPAEHGGYLAVEKSRRIRKARRGQLADRCAFRRGQHSGAPSPTAIERKDQRTLEAGGEVGGCGVGAMMIAVKNFGARTHFRQQTCVVELFANVVEAFDAVIDGRERR